MSQQTQIDPIRSSAVVGELEQQRNILSARCTQLAADLATANSQNQQLVSMVTEERERTAALQQELDGIKARMASGKLVEVVE